jgi:hypothetical protein
VTGPERKAVKIARRIPYIAPRQLAKRADVRLDVARRILEAEQARRAAV